MLYQRAVLLQCSSTSQVEKRKSECVCARTSPNGVLQIGTKRSHRSGQKFVLKFVHCVHVTVYQNVVYCHWVIQMLSKSAGKMNHIYVPKVNNSMFVPFGLTGFNALGALSKSVRTLHTSYTPSDHSLLDVYRA